MLNYYLMKGRPPETRPKFLFSANWRAKIMIGFVELLLRSRVFLYSTLIFRLTEIQIKNNYYSTIFLFQGRNTVAQSTGRRLDLMVQAC